MTHIKASSGFSWAFCRELWDCRELVYFLTLRNIKVRYKQSVLGVAWTILQPTLTMVVFTLFFGQLAKVPSDGLPYPLFAFCALLPWQLFSLSLGEAANSLVGNQQLITKVYFPRLALPLASIFAGLVDFLIAMAVLGALMAWYGVAPTLATLLLPLFVLLAIATALAVGIFLAAVNVRYRDVRYTLPFLTQIWMFCSPIAYPSSMVPEEWRLIYGLNPMAGVVEGFRWALLGSPEAPGPMILVSTAVVVVGLAGALAYFRHAEKTFADVV